MAQITTQLENILRKYIDELETHNFHVKTAYLFGSHSRGENSEYSDIDVALVSDQFEGNSFLDKEKIRRITIDVDYHLSPFPYKTEDFTIEDLFVKEILETGIKIV